MIFFRRHFNVLNILLANDTSDKSFSERHKAKISYLDLLTGVTELLFVFMSTRIYDFNTPYGSWNKRLCYFGIKFTSLWDANNLSSHSSSSRVCQLRAIICSFSSVSFETIQVFYIQQFAWIVSACIVECWPFALPYNFILFIFWNDVMSLFKCLWLSWCYSSVVYERNQIDPLINSSMWKCWPQV